MLIAEKYGLLLGFEDLARLLGKEVRTLQNMHYADKLGIPMKKIGGRYVAHYEDVADYVDSFRSSSEQSPAVAG
jgi:hypothetical protein